MPQVYTAYDVSLVDTNHLVLQMNTSTSTLGVGGRVEFQFPPKLTTDSRRGNWSEGELRGVEPVAVFSTSGPREMNLAWTYIIDGGQWHIRRVADNVRRLRSYFALVRDSSGGLRDRLVVMFKLWGVGGRQPISARIKAIDVKHSDTIVGNPGEAFYLRTDINCDIRLWTKGLVEGTTDSKVTDLRGQREVLTADWF